MSANGKMQNRVKRGHVGSLDPILDFRDPLIYMGCIKLQISNLAQRWTEVSANEKKTKNRSKKVTWGSRDPILNFWDPPNISGTYEARNFKKKIGTDIDRSEC